MRALDRPSQLSSAPSWATTVAVERLLVPLDGSRLAEAALPMATRLAATCGAAIALLHVIERGAPSRVHGERHLADRADAEGYLTQLARQLTGHGPPVEFHVHEAPVGDVARSIAIHADEHASDLVVLSTHGAGGIREALWGSIALRVLQVSRRPMLLTRAHWVTPLFTPRTIMVPLDGTAAAEAALPLASSLAHRMDFHLRLVMVVPTLETTAGEQQPKATFLPNTTRELLDAEEKQAVVYLEQLAASIRSTGVPTFAEVRRGAPVAQLAADAVEHADGLVVAATHGRAGLQTVWSPSVVARLLRRTGAPVLLVPIGEPQPQSGTVP